MKKDKCVLCKIDTQYDEITHIDSRLYYIEGCGQLCPKCYNDTYESSSNNTYKEQFNES
tara:strand:+ start:1366 stop:1542 length:177 start_codon:yes stop_codon:yes gene_type:complete